MGSFCDIAFEAEPKKMGLRTHLRGGGAACKACGVLGDKAARNDDERGAGALAWES